MAGLNTTELAARLAVSKARVSQYVSEGKLEGCYIGDGRARRFDLDKVAHALGRTLHPGQMMGNGAATRDALRRIGGDDAPAAPPLASTGSRFDGQLPVADSDRYEMARTLKAEEEARRLRRQNMAEEGTWVLAEEVERRSSRALAQEVAQFETLLRDAARAVADDFGLDARAVRKVLMDKWRAYRADRVQVLTALAEGAEMTQAEDEADA
ncbi:hypothetical protein [Paracoccus alkenifer]|uniref:Helix-turn-helix domain-containing protein n=1 Tax=Paracoccus alkenifer TaxID=65735 RepID=A0A1H6NDS1_9RHOB|nr:hypothetical protein [Paracoccus alkenifer]SEI10018.1 hypothetical protein SAMN04488075_2860 [Paracoccus alkenifer]